MKRKRKRRGATQKRCPNLIGYVGKATVDPRLSALRMDRRYRDTLQQAKRERNAKVNVENLDLGGGGGGEQRKPACFYSN